MFAESLVSTALQRSLFECCKNIFYKIFVHVQKIVSSLQRK